MSSAAARRWLAGLRLGARRCLREPIIAVLSLSGVFTVISGSPVDGAVLLTVAVALTWEAAHRQHPGEAAEGPAAGEPGGPTAGSPTAGSPTAGSPTAGSPAGVSPAAGSPAAVAAASPRHALAYGAVLVGGALYAVLVGSLVRYSWPATAAVAGLAAAVVAVGWRGPLRPGRDPGKLPARGVALWGGLLITAGLWELAAYFQQENLTAISYAHPTISALTDPLLASHAGRSAALAVWLAAGWYLVER